MPAPYAIPSGTWTRRSTFFWAATGATVGLSNLWQFPYLAAHHGGSAFLGVYLVFLLLVTLPLLLTEAALGRKHRHGIVLAIHGQARRSGLARHWAWAGRASVLAGFLVLSFTTVVGGICLAYVFHGAYGRFLDASTADLAALFSGLVEDPFEYRQLMAWHALFLGLVLVVSFQGVVGGLERAMRVVVPTFLLLLGGLLLVSAELGELARASRYMLAFRPGELGLEGVQLALGHAFFTLGLGLGVWVIFGAYTPPFTRLKRSVLAVALMDTLIALVAGMVLYALVLAGPAEAPEAGFGVVFLQLPAALGNLAYGQFIASAMFLMILLVAWTSSLALVEPVVSWLREWTGAPRGLSVALVGTAAWTMGLVSLYSFNVWADITVLGYNLFRWVELAASGLLIPLASGAMAALVGHRMASVDALRLIGRAPRPVAMFWYRMLGWVLPAAIAFVAADHLARALLP